MTSDLMKLEKHGSALMEVEDEISAALHDPKGLGNHQRRLALMISMGIAELVEVYFHRLGIIKQGSRIKHEWFKKKQIKEMLSNQIVESIENVKHIDAILSISRRIEEKRNDLAYSSPVEEDGMLKEQINSYFEAKKIIESETGGINV